jgi:alpha-ketoglutarate-dependent taurine dioxygenase
VQFRTSDSRVSTHFSTSSSVLTISCTASGPLKIAATEARSRKIRMSELKQRIVGMSLDRRALLEQRLLQARRLNRTQPTIPRRQSTEAAWLSFGQQQMWFLDQLTPGTSTYNIPDAMQVSGPLHVEALEQALHAIVGRHEILRTHLASVDGNPVPLVDEHWKMKVSLFDVRSLPGPERAAEAKKIILQEARKPFDIAQDLMLRASLVRMDENEHLLLFLTHHIAWDVSSKAVLYRELAALYEGFVKGKPVQLQDLPIQYADYAAWQRQRLQGEVFEQQAAYWRKQLGSAVRVLNLPTDRPRPPVQTFHGAKHFFSFSKSLTESARLLSQQRNATLFMTLAASFVAFLHGLTGQFDIAVGSPMVGRNYPELQGLIGFFINTTVLRFQLSNTTTFGELIEQARTVTLGSHAHQDLPFDKLVEVLRPSRDLSRMALVQVNFRVQNETPVQLRLPGVTVKPLFEFIDTATSKFDLALELAPDREGDSFIEYKTDLLEPATIANMVGEFHRALAELLRQPDVPLMSLEALSQLRRRTRSMEKISDKPKMKSLKDFKRKAVDLSQATIHTSALQTGSKLPLLVTPAVENFDLADWAKTNRDFINTKLLEHGAILFRGFNLESPTDFERVAGSICSELFGEYGDLPREGVAGKIYKSTPYPADKMILFHNESSHMSRWPQKINFYCSLPAEQGGATPVADCREVARRMDPKILQKFEEKGLMYVRNFSPGLDVSWQKFFHTHDRSEVEAACTQAGMTCEWTGNDSLRVGQVGQAVTRHPKTGEKVFFNQVQLHHVYCLDAAVRDSLLSIFKREELPRHVYYGDGTEIEDSVMEHVGQVYEQCAVRFQWQKGDMITVDNMLVCHARDPHVGARKICVAMGEMITAQEVAALAEVARN